MRELGGSGTVDEIYEKVVENERIPEEITSIIHDPERGTQTEVAYRLAWSRTYLKKFGLLENSNRGVWALTAKANDFEQLDPQEIVKWVREQIKSEKSKTSNLSAQRDSEVESIESIDEDESLERKRSTTSSRKN